MKNSYLEVTFRHGKPFAAYLYLPRGPKDKSHRTERVEPGLVIDFTRRGKPIGIEITAPGRLSAPVMRVNRPGFPESPLRENRHASWSGLAVIVGLERHRRSLARLIAGGTKRARRG